MIKGAFKQRMVGAIFILSLGVILIPVILDTPNEDSSIDYAVKPEAPALPEIDDVAQIHYVFNEIEHEFHAKPQVAEVAVAVKEPAPAPKLAKLPEPKLAAVPPVAAVTSPPPTPVAKTTGDWTIQLGAFSSADNAKELLRKLSKEGFESYLKETPGKKLVRVFVAPGVEKAKAEALVTKLDSEFGIKGIVVRYREQ